MSHRYWPRVILREKSTVVPRSCVLALAPCAGAAFRLWRVRRFCTSLGLIAESIIRCFPISAVNSLSSFDAKKLVAGNAYLRSLGNRGEQCISGTRIPIAASFVTALIFSYRFIPNASARWFSAKTEPAVAGKTLCWVLRAKSVSGDINTRRSANCANCANCAKVLTSSHALCQ